MSVSTLSVLIMGMSLKREAGAQQGCDREN
jgi:hypothetical protein